MKANESYGLTGPTQAKLVLAQNPDYKLFTREGFAFKGAKEHERDRKSPTFESDMERLYNWSAALDVEVLHDKKEIHINAFSDCDMF